MSLADALAAVFDAATLKGIRPRPGHDEALMLAFVSLKPAAEA